MTQRMVSWAIVGLLACSAAGAQEPKKAGPGKKLDFFMEAAPALGGAAPLFSLADLDGKQFHLKDVLGKKPVVIEFGSYT